MDYAKDFVQTAAQEGQTSALPTKFANCSDGQTQQPSELHRQMLHSSESATSSFDSCIEEESGSED